MDTLCITDSGSLSYTIDTGRTWHDVDYRHYSSIEKRLNPIQVTLLYLYSNTD